jgi:hypothetical protein
MPNPLLGTTTPLDSTVIQQHLDQNKALLVVFDCNDPLRLLALKEYGSEGYLQTKRSIRHNVICTLLSDHTQQTEHKLADMRLYRGL